MPYLPCSEILDHGISGGVGEHEPLAELDYDRVAVGIQIIDAVRLLVGGADHVAEGIHHLVPAGNAVAAAGILDDDLEAFQPGFRRVGGVVDGVIVVIGKHRYLGRGQRQLVADDPYGSG